MRSFKRPKLWAHVVALSFYVGLFPCGAPIGIPTADAKVSPLHMITRQVKKGNMLVVLDTSGSMTGVPGEPFDAATELGVDCDLGEDCREVQQTGQCLVSTKPLTGLPRLCSNDAQCRVGSCKFGNDPCLQDFDCPTVGSVCTLTGKPCQYNSDCGPQGSTCKISGLFCSSIQPCAPAGRCADSNAACNNPGGQCATRYCSDKPTQACTADSDCQVAAPPSGAPTTGLLVHYKYDEPAGTTTVIDYAGGDHTATFTSGGAKRAAGYGGSGSAIDCSEQGYTQAAAANLQLGNTVTMSTWYYRVPNNQDLKFVSWGGGYEFSLYGDGQLGAILGNNFSTWPKVSGAGIPNNAWSHIAFTWDGSVATFYINGAQVGSPIAVSQSVNSSTSSLAVCSGPSPNFYNPTVGMLDNTRVYNTALSAAEVQSIYAAESSGSTGSLFAHWKMDGDGTDSSGNGADLNIASPSFAPSPRSQALDNDASGLASQGNSGGILDKASTKLTFASWFYRPSSVPQTSDEWLLQRQIVNGVHYRMLLSPTNFPCFTVGWSGGFNQACALSAVASKDAWHHVAGTWDGTTGDAKIYLDGVLAFTQGGTPASVAASSGSLYVGNDGSGNKFHGKMDDVRLYSSVLSDAEIAALANPGSGLVFNLDFENNVTDQSGNGFNGIREGTTTYVAGPRGQGLQFDGSSGCVQIPAAQGSRADIHGPFTVAYFLYRESIADATHVFRKGAASWNPSITMFSEGSPDRFTTWIRNDVNQRGNPNELISPGAWHHVAVTWDGAALRNYLDGVQVFMENSPTPDANPDPSPEAWFLGCESHGGADRRKWSALRLDDFRVYDKAIPATEVASLAASGGITPSTPLLLGHWKFDEGTGTSVADQSAFGHTLQLYCTDSTNANPNQTGANCPNGMEVWKPGHTGSPSDKSVEFLYYEYGEVPGSVVAGKLTNQVTVSAWVYKSLNSANRWVVHQQPSPNTYLDGLGIYIDAGPSFSFTLPGAKLTDPAVLTLGAWHHVVGTYDGTTMRLYKDGALVASQAYSFTFGVNAERITMGAGTNYALSDEYLDGFISELAIWDKAISATEVAALNTGTLPAAPPAGAVCKSNSCNGGDNSCNVSLNICQGGQVNTCAGVNNTDVCNINQTSKGPAKMCRLEQTFCAVDAHCTQYPGDECVPATSRSVVAKRVLKNVLLNNSDIMNFGLMAFSQGNADGATWDKNNDGTVNASDKDGWPDDYYFPYYKVKTGGGGTAYEDRFFTVDELLQNNCYDKAGGPAASCTIGPTTFSLRGGINARYTVYQHGNFVQVDQPFCGDRCVIYSVTQGWLFFQDPSKPKNTDARGTGRFAGALYTYPVSSGTYDLWDQPVFLQSYQGRTTTISGDPYVYFKPRNDYYWDPQAGANRPPIKGAQCADKCSVTCGGNWDPNLVPFMDTTDVPAASKANMVKMLPMLEKARDGGFMHWERGPVGCALINDFAGGSAPIPADKKRFSAWDYLEEIKAKDQIPCRDDFILLITDGETNGPGDVDASGKTTCDNPDCRVQWDDPNATVGPTCQCKSVINALKLRNATANGGLIVKTYVIGFSPDSNIGVPGVINENIARAGGTCRAPYDNTIDPVGAKDKCMFLANNETELQEAIQSVIFDAIKGSYSTTPASATSGVQVDDKKVTPGGILFDARVDFPSWRGHLLAYDTTDVDPVTQQPKLMWDAGSPTNFPDPNDVITYKNWSGWKYRRVYTSAGNTMVPIQVDTNSGDIVNRTQLLALGLGNTDVESERIAQWLLGDPRQRNKAVLGAFVNSTPIEVGPAGLSGLPGGKRFFDAQKNRVSLVYAAGDDGMLHAFYTRDTTIGGKPFKGGEEAFAYIPPDMLLALTRLYTQGGQKADPRDHIFGLTSSPKMKNVCWTNCDDDATADWKSILVMTDGWGGTETFMLDVTSPFVSGNFANPPLQIIWHTDTVMPADKALFDAYQGDTVSVPAFYYGKSTSKDDYRVVYASGYRSNPPTSAAQGITLMNVSARNGSLLDADTITSSACSVELTALTDVAAARNFDFREQQQMLGAFFGDTAGNLWRYVPAQVGPNNNTGTTGNLSLVKSLGCDHPLHFAPTIVQLDRDDPLNHPGEVYVVQVTNSALDPETDGFAPSKMIIRKEARTSSVGGLSPDNTWISGGQLEFDAGSATLCAIWDPNGNSGSGSCNQVLPPNARPTSTPLAILKSDGTGFLLMSLWYAPATTVCGLGRSYLLLHTMDVGGGGLKQKAGIGLVNEAVTSAVIVDKKVVYTDSQGKVHDVTSQLNQTFIAGGAISDISRNGGLRFQQTGWVEVP